ncbi:hypothetical protein NDU88_004628 [Pleurodeles waltl]|uniref:Uncharacterized protein n=1 Tax=Pleurodeles waltl TaxID=8319 RepID=A0AAV7WW21_PLEWA|nr:hypothetical protein NDU88_004628 [Pleurodeles waltl]
MAGQRRGVQGILLPAPRWWLPSPSTLTPSKPRKARLTQEAERSGTGVKRQGGRLGPKPQKKGNTERLTGRTTHSREYATPKRLVAIRTGATPARKRAAIENSGEDRTPQLGACADLPPRNSHVLNELEEEIIQIKSDITKLINITEWNGTVEDVSIGLEVCSKEISEKTNQKRS